MGFIKKYYSSLRKRDPKETIFANIEWIGEKTTPLSLRFGLVDGEVNC